MKSHVSAVLAVASVLMAAPPSHAGCYGPEQQLPAQTISAFLADPSQLLSQYPHGGRLLISQVRDLAASDAPALQALIGLLARANKDQRAAIGTGLGQASRACLGSNPTYANEIQQALAASGNQDAIAGYAAVTGDVPIGATGGGGGGGGGGTGGPTGSSGLAFGGTGVGLEVSSSSFTSNTSGNLLTGGFVGTSGSLSGSVSP